MMADSSTLINFLIDFFKKIPKEQIEQYVKEKKDLLPLIKESLRKLALYLVKRFLQNNWHIIEEYLTDTDKLVNLIITVRPDLKDLFQRKETLEWLYENVKRIYDFLYNFAWGTK